MNIELISVEPLKDGVFEVVTSVEGRHRRDVLTREYDGSPDAGGIPILTAVADDFSEIWGSSLELRREIGSRVRALE